MNTVFAQELVATSLGNFITRNSGLRVVFESAIVPDWRGGVISFNRCFVSRRPKKKVKGNKKAMKAIAATATASLVDETEKKKQEVASAKTTTTAVSDVGFRKGNINDAIASIEKNEEVEDDDEEYEDDGNYTQFDLTIDQVNVSLSLGKFLNGKGILNEVEIVGMRGVVDRSFVHWDPNDDARNYKNVYKPGDFEIDNFKMSDVLFKLIQPNGFRPFNVSIYNCDLPIFRKNWLLLDFLNANSISGSYDDSLFTIHKRHVTEYGPDGSEKLRRVTTCRVDALNVDHLNTGLEGPFGWITSGEVDMIGDIRIPQEDETINVGEIIQSISEKLSKDSLPASRIRSSSSSSSSHTTSSSSTTTHPTSANSMNFTDRRFILDLRINLNKVKAAVPIFTDDLSYVNNALIRPIVGYINSRKTYIPIRCTITKDISDFDGSWTVYDSLLMDDISVQVYDAFVEYVANEEKRVERLKRVGFWSLQLVFQVLLMSLGLIA
jgi:distribution and morphology protein 31